MTGPERVAFTVAPGENGQRLDQLLPAHVPGLSRRRARVLIDLGGVFIDRRRVKMAGRPMKAGEKVVAHLGGALLRAGSGLGIAARAADEQRLPSYTVVHEDADVLVVDKPAGLLTAPTPESDRGNLLALLERRGGPGTKQPVHLVHRLDLPTSGLVVFARSEDALRVLAERFRTHDLEREYLGVVAGVFPDKIQVIEQPVERRPARTWVKVERRFGARATLLRFKLDTGRTHQIRLHARGLGHPVLGDRRYGEPTSFDPPRLALHATRLALEHPTGGPRLEFESPLPPDLAAWIERLTEAPRPNERG